jgi:lysylphosphatidylglycerol synthetase-like protein (DUF2156 family)
MQGRGFFAELKRRHVYRAGAIYVMGAWVLIQVSTQTLPFFNVPAWVIRFIILGLVLACPVVLVLAWAFEITPEGIVKTDDLPAVIPPQQRASRRRIDWTIIAVLFLIICALLAQQRGLILPNKSRDKSIAVLPFENYSDDKENAFFADGIQDDLLNNLAKIKDL